MKKFAITCLVLALAVCLWIIVRQKGGLQLGFLQGKIEQVTRGDLMVPITAQGTVQPKDRIEIKSEAGGTVVETPFEEGEVVKAGDVLVKLDPEDEQRKVNIFAKALEQARISLRLRETDLYQREHVFLPAAQGKLAQVVAELSYAEWQHQRYQDSTIAGSRSEDEYRRTKSQLESLLAQKTQLEAEVRRAESDIESARLNVEQAKLAEARAVDDLADAQERLAETIIRAPIDGMLVQLFAKKGMVISSGSQSFTSGTVLAFVADVSEMYVRTFVDEADIGRVLEIAPATARPGLAGDHRQTEGLVMAQDPTGESGVTIALGTPVKATVEAFPDMEFSGVIELIEPEPDGTDRVVTTYAVRIRLTGDEALHLLPGMQASVEFVAQRRDNVLIVPNEAVRFVNDQRGVYAVGESRKTPGKKIPVFKTFRAGLDDGAYTEVIEGLEEGERIYVRLPRDRDGNEVTGDE